MKNYSNRKKISCCQGTWVRAGTDCKGILGNIFGVCIYILKLNCVDGCTFANIYQISSDYILT